MNVLKYHPEFFQFNTLLRFPKTTFSTKPSYVAPLKSLCIVLDTFRVKRLLKEYQASSNPFLALSQMIIKVFNPLQKKTVSPLYTHNLLGLMWFYYNTIYITCQPLSSSQPYFPLSPSRVARNNRIYIPDSRFTPFCGALSARFQ